MGIGLGLGGEGNRWRAGSNASAAFFLPCRKCASQEDGGPLASSPVVSASFLPRACCSSQEAAGSLVSSRVVSAGFLPCAGRRSARNARPSWLGLGRAQ